MGNQSASCALVNGNCRRVKVFLLFFSFFFFFSLPSLFRMQLVFSACSRRARACVCVCVFHSKLEIGWGWCWVGLGVVLEQMPVKCAQQTSPETTGVRRKKKKTESLKYINLSFSLPLGALNHIFAATLGSSHPECHYQRRGALSVKEKKKKNN